MTCRISKSTNITEKISTEINQQMGELKTTVSQTKATTDYLLIKNHHDRQQFSGMCCLNMSDFSHIITGQINDLNKKIEKESLK